MAFADTVRGLPYAARTQQGAGFVPPMVRAMGHLLFLAACVNDPDVTVTNEEARTEIGLALEHWIARATPPSVSTASANRAVAIATAITEARDEYEGWDDNARVNNLRDLTNRILQYCADLDRELTGLRDSDAGTAL